MADDKKGKEKGKKKGGADEGSDAGPLQIWVGRARGIGGIVGFAVAYHVCRGQGFAQADAILRGLAGAVAMSLVAWWSALMVIQALMRSAAAQAQREAYAAAAARQAQEPAYGRSAPASDDMS